MVTRVPGRFLGRVGSPWPPNMAAGFVHRMPRRQSLRRLRSRGAQWNSVPSPRRRGEGQGEGAPDLGRSGRRIEGGVQDRAAAPCSPELRQSSGQRAYWSYEAHRTSRSAAGPFSGPGRRARSIRPIPLTLSLSPPGRGNADFPALFCTPTAEIRKRRWHKRSAGSPAAPALNQPHIEANTGSPALCVPRCTSRYPLPLETTGFIHRMRAAQSVRRLPSRGGQSNSVPSPRRGEGQGEGAPDRVGSGARHRRRPSRQGRSVVQVRALPVREAGGVLALRGALEIAGPQPVLSLVQSRALDPFRLSPLTLSLSPPGRGDANGSGWATLRPPRCVNAVALERRFGCIAGTNSRRPARRGTP
jgi:hypothetical protein